MSIKLIIEGHQVHTFENNAEVDLGTQNKEERNKLICPFKVKDNRKHTQCWPNNIFHKSEYCNDCPDYWKNYNIIVYDGIRSAELDPKSNIHLIRADIERDGGKYVRMYNDEPVLLIAATSTIEDYYWLYMDRDRNLKLSSCVGNYEVITDEKELECMSIVEYLRVNEREEMLKKINDYIDSNKYDKLITEIHI